MERTSSLPKLLPWLAKHAGIEQDRAVILWRQAERDAAKQVGTENAQEISQLAMEQFRSLLEQESLQMDAASCGIRPLVRSQANWLRTAVESYERAANRLRYWRRLSLQTFSIASGLGRR